MSPRSRTLPVRWRTKDEARQVFGPGVIWRIGRDPDDPGDIELLTRISAVDDQGSWGQTIGEDDHYYDRDVWSWGATTMWPWGTVDESDWLVAVLQGRWVPREE